MRLRINEVLLSAKAEGRKIWKKDLAAKLFPESNPISQKINMTNLCIGKTDRVKPEWVVILCREIGCSADDLFGI